MMVVINSNDPRGVVFKKQTSEKPRAASFSKTVSDLVEQTALQTEHHRSPLCATQLKTETASKTRCPYGHIDGTTSVWRALIFSHEARSSLTFFFYLLRSGP